MKRFVAAITLTGLLAQGCYSFEPWGAGARVPHYAQTRDVHVGATLEVRAHVTPNAITLTSLAIPQCHHAQFGTLYESQSRTGTPSFLAHLSWFVFLAGAETAFIAVANQGGQNNVSDNGLFVTGLAGMAVTTAMLLLYLPSLAMDNPLITPWFMPHRNYQTRSIQAGPTSAWDGETHACGDAAGYPSLPVTVVAHFANTQRSLMWRGTTASDDTISFQITRTIQAVAHYCGTPHVEYGQLVPKDRPPPNVDEGSPDAPRAVLHDARDVVVDVSGDLNIPVDSIGDAWARQVATECHRATLDTCADNMGATAGDAARDACAEQCATKLVGDLCVLKKRNCIAVMSGPSDKVYCDQGLDRCVTENGATLSSLDSCKKQCFDQALSARCH